jgi:hypothetical protein
MRQAILKNKPYKTKSLVEGRVRDNANMDAVEPHEL